MPLADFLTGLEWVADCLGRCRALPPVSFARFGLTVEALVGAVFMAILVLLVAINLRQRIYPNLIVGPSCLLVLALVLLGGAERAAIHLGIGAVAAWCCSCR